MRSLAVGRWQGREVGAVHVILPSRYRNKVGVDGFWAFAAPE